VPCLAVNKPSQFLADEQVRARELLGTVTHPALGTYAQLRSPALVDGRRAAPSVPPRLGQHTAVGVGALRSAATACTSSAFASSRSPPASPARTPAASSRPLARM